MASHSQRPNGICYNEGGEKNNRTRLAREVDSFDLTLSISPSFVPFVSFSFLLRSSFFRLRARARVFHTVIVAGDAVDVIVEYNRGAWKRETSRRSLLRCSVRSNFLIISERKGARFTRGAVIERLLFFGRVSPRIYLSARPTDSLLPFSHFLPPSIPLSLFLTRVLTNFKRSDNILQEIRSFPARHPA